MRRLGWMFACLLLAACDGEAPDEDAGPPGTVDAGDGDAGDGDAGDAPVDAGPPPPPPEGLIAIDDLELMGAFRVSNDEFGPSSVNYAVGTLGYHAANESLFIAGHAQHNAIAEFAIPATLGTAPDVGDLPLVESPLQAFAQPLGATPDGNPDGMDRVTGLYMHDGHLIVQANRWYDASGGADDTSLLMVDGQLDGEVRGYFELEGRARSAGFISPIPPEWRGAPGAPPPPGGGASNYSIISRYSVGPTLYAFDPSDLTDQASDPSAGGPIAARAWMEFPHGDAWLAEDADYYACSPNMATMSTDCDADASASDLWNWLSKAMYGFIVPGTRTYAVLGSSGGVDSGIGYKIWQSNGNLCGGACAYEPDDYYNYYWFFDLDEIVSAAEPSSPRPYAYGRWSVPYDDDGAHRIIGGAWDPDGEVLYLSLANAAQVGDYDRPPLIVAFQIAE